MSPETVGYSDQSAETMDRVVCLLRELSIVISLLNHGSSCTSPETVGYSDQSAVHGSSCMSPETAGYSDQSAEIMCQVVFLMRHLGIVNSLLKRSVESSVF